MIQPTAKIQISVVPRSARAGIAVSETGVVKVHLTSPPVEGRANEELISLLARRLHVPKSRIAILAGLKGRTKIVGIEGISKEEALARLAQERP